MDMFLDLKVGDVIHNNGSDSKTVLIVLLERSPFGSFKSMFIDCKDGVVEIDVANCHVEAVDENYWEVL